MLETTLATTFEPGTNLKGQVAGANWTFLLPNLNVERIVCVGLPLSSTVATLSGIGRDVTIVCMNQLQFQTVEETKLQNRYRNVEAVLADGHAALPVPGNSVDLVYVVKRNGNRQFRGGRALQAEVQRILKPEAMLYLEFNGPMGRAPKEETIKGFIGHFGQPELFWLTPLNGEMHTAVPVRYRETFDYFLRNKLYSTSVNLLTFKRLLKQRQPANGSDRSSGRMIPRADVPPRSPFQWAVRSAGLGTQGALERAERFLMRRHLASRRYGILMSGAVAGSAGRPPQYLRSIAKQAGVDISEFGWGLSAPGDYNSRKVLFFLLNREDDTVDASQSGYIVKMVRDPIFNPRLENECRALTLLHEKGIGARKSVPQMAFFGYHNELAVVGETIVDGVPFRQRSKATPDCPYALAAIDWLTDLGWATADPGMATVGQVAGVLDTLFERFMQIYQLSPAHYDFLAGQIAAIRYNKIAFPLVFQHGDPGTWNAMVTHEGCVSFLDWEAAEPAGLPLWDLFYFLRSHAMGIARANGIRDRLAGFRQLFLDESPFSRLVVESTERYCQEINLSKELVEPLFYTCWMHRSLKESTRLTRPELESGHYVSLLRLCIEQRHASLFDRLFSEPVVDKGSIVYDSD